MKIGTLLFIFGIFWSCFSLADKFVEAKIKNDSSIAADTRRIADALSGRIQ